MLIGIAAPLAGRTRNLDDKTGAAARKLDRQPAAMRLGALAHRRQAPAAAARAARPDRIGEAAPVILDAQPEAARVLGEAAVPRAARAVLGGVGERFLGDAQQRQLRIARQALIDAGPAQASLPPGARAELRDVPPPRRRDAERC